MHRRLKRVAVAAATIGLLVAMGSSVRAGGRGRTTMWAPDVSPAPDGHVRCRVVATSRTRIQVVASIVSEDGTNCTEFSTSFRASPEATEDGRYYAEETAGSFADDARFCKTWVTGAAARDVDVTMTSYDAQGEPLAVTWR